MGLLFDYTDGDYVLPLSDDMAMDADGNMMMRMDDNMSLDMDSGEIHYTSGWSRCDEDSDED